jgi:hypothetical protein
MINKQDYERTTSEFFVNTIIRKPIMEHSYKEILNYLIKVVNEDDIPNYAMLINIASYCNSNNGITDKQKAVVDGWIKFFRQRGLL